MEQVKNFSIEQLAALCVGYGPGIPFAAFSKQEQPETILDGQGNPLTKNDHPVGAKGYVSPAMPEKGIHSIFYKDGPAGVGTGAWPTAMLISCAFNKELWEAFGNAVGRRVQKRKRLTYGWHQQSICTGIRFAGEILNIFGGSLSDRNLCGPDYKGAFRKIILSASAPNILP